MLRGRHRRPAASPAVIVFALSVCVATFIAWRSRSITGLRPTAVLCSLFIGLDAARTHIGGMGHVLAFCTLPACWMALLVRDRRGGPSVPGECKAAGIEATPGGWNAGPWPVQDRLSCLVVRILPCLAPFAACLAYAAALLALRHESTVRAHWTEALQLPRLVAFGWALAVALRWRLKDEGLGGYDTTEPQSVCARSATFAGNDGCRLPTAKAPLTYAPTLPPSTAIGVVMALGGGICAASGLWTDWADVRIVAAVAWGLSAAIAWRAR